ncbi:hypothetical protein NQ117_10165 [Paenibacillus sp. SC116]|uniref:hypothetical protein n=1 Tax=Paenibacillus sp. SC116 TaxID=2968986 RepID=UPI00215B4350|nr:hypothetical protein [Paenibacillus sp. SC116]MCR8844049.1 hypothetical protein [Paenibacillus sp. SC116]
MYPNFIDQFSEKLNKKPDGRTHMVEETLPITNGKYEGQLRHDNIINWTIKIYTGPHFSGQEVRNYNLSSPADMPWRSNIQVFSNSPHVYVTYETSGDTIEADDVNEIQNSIMATQSEVERYKKVNDTSLLKKADKVYVDVEVESAKQAALTKAKEIVSRLDSGVILNDRYFNEATIHMNRNGVDVIEYWLLINARYDSETKRFKRIDVDNFSFGWQMQAGGTYPGEENIGDFINQGMNLWKANGRKAYAVGDPMREQTGEDIGALQPDGTWKEYGIMLGWVNHFMCDAYGGMTIGGSGFEIDGSGTYPFCRVSLGKFVGGSSVPNRPVQEYVFSYNGTCWNTQHGIWNKDVDSDSGFFFGMQAPINFYDQGPTFNPWSNRADLKNTKIVWKHIPPNKAHHIENIEDILELDMQGRMKLKGLDVPRSIAIDVTLNAQNAADVFFPDASWTKDNSYILSIKGVAADGKLRPILNYDAIYNDYGLYLGVPGGFTKVVVLLAKI